MMLALQTKNGLRHSVRLRTKMQLAEPRLGAVSRAFWNHPRLPEMLGDFLFMAYCICRSTVPLLKTAEHCARRKANVDPIDAQLVGYCSRHAQEEMHHDKWLLEDMVAIGMNRPESLNRIPSPTMASLIGSQYYWMESVHPGALLGYVAVLEGYPPSAEQIQKIRIKHDLGPQAFRTMLKHASLDPHHREDLNQQLDELPLTEQVSALVTVSALHTMEKISCGFEEILDSYGCRRNK